MTDNGAALLAAIIGASAAITAAVIGAIAAVLTAQRAQLRVTYGEAIRAATAWVELLYRVRRRTADEEKEIRNLFHEAQDRLLYYKAWVGTDQQAMARSYAKLVDGVQTQTRSSIQQAWEEELRPARGNAQPDEEHPNITPLVDAFLTDVRDRMSLLPWKRHRVKSRNP